MIMRAASLILSAFFAVATVVASPPSHAASSIRVKVDDQPITSYDIAQRTKLFEMTGVKGGQKAATEELIDETIQFIEAAKNGHWRQRRARRRGDRRDFHARENDAARN